MNKRQILAAVAGIAMIFAATSIAQQAPADGKKKKQQKDRTLGYDDTDFNPGQPWRVHDISRPRPKKVTPGAAVGQPPSDAIVLFDGKDLSKWLMTSRGSATTEPNWKVENGYFEVVPRSGSLVTKEKFGDCQLHIEWMVPLGVEGKGQDKGNSGVILMSNYEIQVLESFENQTYADGQAGAIYGQWPPLVNATRPMGEWQTYDIFFEAPKFAAGMVAKPAYFTVVHNGVLLHHHKEVLGRMIHAKVATYAPHEDQEPLMLQNHGHPIRYRNIWMRRLQGYDRP